MRFLLFLFSVVLFLSTPPALSQDDDVLDRLLADERFVKFLDGSEQFLALEGDSRLATRLMEDGRIIEAERGEVFRALGFRSHDAYLAYLDVQLGLVMELEREYALSKMDAGELSQRVTYDVLVKRGLGEHQIAQLGLLDELGASMEVCRRQVLECRVAVTVAAAVSYANCLATAGGLWFVGLPIPAVVELCSAASALIQANGLRECNCDEIVDRLNQH